MTKPDKPLELVFAEGCFDNWEGTQEELDEFIAEIRKLVESGEILERSEPVDDEEAAQVIELMSARKPRN